MSPLDPLWRELDVDDPPHGPYAVLCVLAILAGSVLFWIALGLFFVGLGA